MRHYTGIDKFINSFDQALRSLVPGTTSAQRENPGKAVETQLAVSEARHVALFIILKIITLSCTNVVRRKVVLFGCVMLIFFCLRLKD